MSTPLLRPFPTRPLIGPVSRDGAVDARNMALLVQLRWLAVAGQIITISVVMLYFRIELPLGAMAAVIAGLVALNIASITVLRFRPVLASRLLALTLAVDIMALTLQLALSGGPSNPFAWLWLLQVTLSATMLSARTAAFLAALVSVSFALVAWKHLPLALPGGTDPLGLYILGSFFCLALVAALIVGFVTRANNIRRARDAELSDLRRRDEEQEHIVRMGLLASGAAHELGTPLSSIAVILGDWRAEPRFSGDAGLAEEIATMQRAISRCKEIVTGILASSGETRGDAPHPTTVHRFLDEVLRGWSGARSFQGLEVVNTFGSDMVIISDTALAQMVTNVLDNAAEVSPARIRTLIRREDDSLVIAVRDFGKGFDPAVLSELGRPYISTKGSAGRGLGLFLASNVARKLGGSLAARNCEGKGAEVSIRLPLRVLALGERHFRGESNVTRKEISSA